MTGFDPFGGEAINPSYEAVKRLPIQVAGAEIVRLEVHTTYEQCVQQLEEALVQHAPQAVLSVGQAGGRSALTPEVVAINLMDATAPDNAGAIPVDQPVCPGGPAAYFTTLPVKAMVARMRGQGVPANLSYTAGTYVCNTLMYYALHAAATRHPGMLAGFVHVPFEAGQAAAKAVPPASLPLDLIVRGLELCLEEIVSACAQR